MRPTHATDDDVDDVTKRRKRPPESRKSAPNGRDVIDGSTGEMEDERTKKSYRAYKETGKMTESTPKRMRMCVGFADVSGERTFLDVLWMAKAREKCARNPICPGRSRSNTGKKEGRKDER